MNQSMSESATTVYHVYHEHDHVSPWYRTGFLVLFWFIVVLLLVVLFGIVRFQKRFSVPLVLPKAVVQSKPVQRVHRTLNQNSAKYASVADHFVV